MNNRPTAVLSHRSCAHMPARWQTFALLCAQLGLFYYGLLTQPATFIRFSYRYNKLWYAAAPSIGIRSPRQQHRCALPRCRCPASLRCGGWLGGLAMTLVLPATPFIFAGLEWAKRLKTTLVPHEDWKTAGPGRTWFTPPKSMLATLVFDAYSPLQTYVGAFVLFGDDPVGIMHTWYDEVCTKEWWTDKLTRVGARMPRQLGSWEGDRLVDEDKGVADGNCGLVCKISDSYLGIGDHVFRRGVDFKVRPAPPHMPWRAADAIAPLSGRQVREDIEAVLKADPQYDGKRAVLRELIRPTGAMRVSSDGYGQVHSLDILTLCTEQGVKVLSLVLWTDCTTWSSHSATVGYLVDVETETIVAPTAWCGAWSRQ